MANCRKERELRGNCSVVNPCDFHRGYRAGRKGKVIPKFSNQDYVSGWREGMIALEESENGFDPRFMKE